MIPVLSLVTSIKDYLEVVHKLIEYDSSNLNISYSELGTILTYLILSIKNGFIDFISFSWLKNIWSLPIIIPDISSAMISEISVLDGYFHNAFNFLDTPISYGEQNVYLLGLEKFSIGVLNSLFLCLPTSTAHIITLRRFVMQGLEAGFISGLGTIAGNLLWLTSVILGWRFIVIPWLSLDIFRYLLGFMLLVKYMWDSYNERRMVLEDLSKQKIFLLTFLLALTEQTSIYPFISNLSISPEASIFESFPAENSTQFIFIHLAYLLGIAVGSVSLLNLTCWFWENPAFKLYMWMISSFKVSTSLYYRALSSVFLYLTMISAISSIPYYGLDYTITNPLGYVNEDRLIQDKTVLETSFLGSKASDRNTRRNRGRHGRRERWKRRIRKYRTFDASLYDQGIYDLFTIEDLNYGFDRFWLRRKLRNHRVRFRFFPGPWMRSFKKQLAKPRLESYTGPRVEFFRILFEQVYHPSFHAYDKVSPSGVGSGKTLKDKNQKNESLKAGYAFGSGSTKDSLTKFSYLSNLNIPEGQKEYSLYSSNTFSLDKGTSLGPDPQSPFGGWGKNIGKNNKEGYLIQNDWRSAHSTLRKFVRKLDSRLKTAQIVSSLKNMDDITTVRGGGTSPQKLYSKRWKHIFSKMSRGPEARVGRTLVNSSFTYNKENVLESKNLSKKDLQILRYRSFMNSFGPGMGELSSQSSRASGLVNKVPSALDRNGKLNEENFLPSPQVPAASAVLLHPLKFYLQKQKGFERKLRYYTPSIFRKFSVENNAPYFRVMMRRYFYNYKATNRWERTMKDASLRKARRKTTRIPRKLPSGVGGNFQNSFDPGSGEIGKNSQQNLVSTQSNILSNDGSVTILNNRLIKPTNNYSVVSKRASRYRYQIYKDVLQHWYYSPFNRMLMKFDVDSFIRRQPNSHFLTPKEENLLHLRRFLLSEHYNTLRWYTNMEHYRSMKTRINGTKSFSSQVYNQQFSGTFKKIRHLFAITPSQGNVVLKFDQPLYNEYTKLNPLILHEELLAPSEVGPSNDYSQNSQVPPAKQGGQPGGNDDLISQSQKLVREYLIQTRGAREDYIKELLNQNNYTTLTQFLYKGGKTRGDSPVTNQRLLNNQEKDMLFTTNEKREMDEQFNKEKIRNFINNKSFMEDLYLSYLFKWKRRVNDQEFLKNYLTRRIDKREKRKQRKEKNLYAKLKRLQTLDEYSSLDSGKKPLTVGGLSPNSQSIGQDKLINREVASEYLTSGLQKSILEGMYTLKNLDVKTTSLYEKSLWKVLLLSKIKNMNGVGNVLSERTQTFRDLKVSQQRLISKEIRISASQLTSVLEKLKKDNLSPKVPAANRSIFNNYKNPTKRGIIKKLSQKINRVYKMFKTNIPSYLGLTKIQNLLKPIKRKSLKNWRKKERALGKQRLRKDFKLLNKKTELSPLNETLSNLDRNEMNNALVLASSRKKRSFNPTISDLSFNKLLNTSEPNGSKILSETGDFAGIASSRQNPGSSEYSLLNLLGRDFKRKRSPQRRSRVRRNRGVFKKRTLNDTLKKDIKTFKNTDTLTTDVKKSFYEKMNMLLYQPSRSESLETSFLAQGLKQRKSKQRKQRYWKQKRSKYSQKRRKYRKRRRYALGKIRVLSKVLKRVKNKHEIQNWWWKKYMPSVQASTDALWQIEKDMFIQQKLSEFSTAEILERDRMNNSSLQIGSKDFKPLAIPQNIRLQSLNKDPLSFDVSNTTSLNTNAWGKAPGMDTPGPTAFNRDLVNDASSQTSTSIRSESDRSNFQTVNKLYENLFINKNGSQAPQVSAAGALASGTGGNSLSNDFMLPNTMLPFYAGWDESLRKFIVTNRMLSRLDAGYEVKQLDNTTVVPALKPLTDRLPEKTPTLEKQSPFLARGQEEGYTPWPSARGLVGVGLNNSVIEFTNAPLQGMNAATTLYWQIPFTTYDPDQFFALGMDGFSPIGWRKFVFRHSILKSWLNTINTQKSLSSLQTSKAGDNEGSSGTLIVKVKQDIQNINSDRNSQNYAKQLSSGVTVANPGALSTMLNLATQKNEKFKSYSFGKESGVDSFEKNVSRRLKKRYRRVKKHPRTPVWFPSGPLLNQVLPVHYIYVFYKRSRLPRDRYLKRRLLTKQKIMESEGFQKAYASNPSSSFYDFTLRKRLKPKRKYHLKRDFYSKNLVIPRRFKFISSVDSSREIYHSLRMRPLSSKKINKPIADLVKEQKLMRTKQRRKELSSNQQTPMLRVKQLRRRVQRQILRSVWRYRPRAGGFVWPGDYLKLESVKAPKLKEKTSGSKNSLITAEVSLSLRKTKRKKKRNLVEWQIQPKKYLYQKHNLKVLKKKLEKAQRSDKIQQKIKEFSYKF